MSPDASVTRHRDQLRRRWRARGNLSAEQRRAVLDAVALRTDRTALVRFGVLQALAVVIAVMGLRTDSPAVVIGAMLVAPLMGPIMGVSASLAMGWGRRAGRAATLVVLSGLGSVLLAAILSALMPGAGITDEVVARTAPGATDLVIALAAGLAGAYATVRPDISASLPGVAVAVALVPPLATVGVTWEAGQTGLAAGALLLFVTNLAAIVLAGLVVFPLTGFVPARRLRDVRGRVILNASLVLAVVFLLGALLTGRTLDAAGLANEVARTRRLATDWLAGTGLEVTAVSLDGRHVLVAVSGPDAPPDPTPLARRLTEALGLDADLEVQWSQRSSVSADSNGLRSLDDAALRREVLAWLAESGESADSFDVTLQAGESVLLVQLSGPVAPPDGGSLERRLGSRFGVTVPVSIEASLVVPDAAERETAQLVTGIATAWAAERGLTLAAVDVQDGTVMVTLEGPRPPSEGATLRTQLEVALGAAVQLTLRHRTATLVPADASSEFRWPLDCGASPEASVSWPPAAGSFTSGAVGAWLRGRLYAAGIDFADDASSFARDDADGTLFLWAVPATASTPPVVREIDEPTARGGPRGAERRALVAGPLQVWAALVPHEIERVAGSTCAPTTAALDAWFAALGTSMSAFPYAGVAPSGAGPTPRAGTPHAFVVDLARESTLPVARTIDGEVVLVVSGRSVPLAVGVEPVLGAPTGATRRAGGVSLSTTTSTPEVLAVLDRLAAALARRPYMGSAG